MNSSRIKQPKMSNNLNAAMERTAAKIRYARLHLDELQNHSQIGTGDDFERSHIESFLFHLYGARDAFLQELNIYYNCGLMIEKVRVETLKKCFKESGIASQELKQLLELENDPKKWLYLLKEMRHHSMHRKNISRRFFMGGPQHGEVHLQNPKTQDSLNEDFKTTFEIWLSEMEKLLEQLRKNYSQPH